MKRSGQSRQTIGSLMVLVCAVAVGLGLYRFLTATQEGGWLDRLILVHVLGLGVLVPLGTLAGFVLFASGRPDQEERRALIVVMGALGWVFIFGSLVFWFIILVLIGSDR